MKKAKKMPKVKKDLKMAKAKKPKGVDKIKKVMHEFKEHALDIGKSKKKVKKRSQAVAIALSEARKAGAKIKKK